MEGMIGSASTPGQETHPRATSQSRFAGLQMRSTTQANRTHDKGIRAAPYIAPSRERTEWATPMRAAPARDPAGSPTPATPHASVYRGSHVSKSRGMAGGGGGGGANVARTGNSPDEGRRLSQRDKQVSYGYVTDGYKNMIRLVNHDPLLQSGGILPLSPPDVQRGSKRTWDIQLRKWRRALHMFDHVFIDGEDDEARRGDVIEQQRLQWINIAFLTPAATTDTDAKSDTVDGATTKLSATMETAQSHASDDSDVPAAPLKPRVERVRLSLDTLLAVRRSPLVPTKLPVEDELRCILASDDCFESVRNVVPQTASSLTRGTDISPLEAGIKIHIAPSAAVLRQQQEQQQRHQDTLQHTRQQSMPHADHSESRTARPSPSLPQTVVGRGGGGGGESLWRRTTAVSVPAASTDVEDRYSESPSAPGRGVANRGSSPSAAPGTPWSAAAATAGMESSPAPRRPGNSSADLWSPEPRLAPPPPLHHGTASSMLHSPSPMGPRQSAGHPQGPVMVMMMPTTMPDGSTMMIPTGFYTDPRAGGATPMLLSPAAAAGGRGGGGGAAPCMPIMSPGVPGLCSPNGSWVDGLSSPQPVQPFAMMPFSSQPGAASSSAASMPRWRQSQSRLRAEDPQTVPRFVPMLSASKSESRLAERLVMAARPHSDPTADVAVAAQSTKSTPADPHAASPAVFSTPSQRHDGDGDAQRALFTAADDDDDEGRTGGTAPRATNATDADVGEVSLLKVVLHNAHPQTTHQLGGDAVAQDLFGQ